MATAATPSSAQRQEDFKEQFLTCPICCEEYDKDDHQAKFLPCLHSYCKSCLRQHACRRPKINCPNCRKEVALPDGTVDSLPNDFIVENLTDYQDIFNMAVKCGSCADENTAISFCHDCGCFLCEVCVDYHNKMHPLRNHKLSTMTELQQKKCNPTNQHKCKNHPTKPLDLFCKEANCRIPACASCALTDHQGHKIVDLAAAIEEIVAILRLTSTEVAFRNQELVKKRAAVDNLQKTLTDNFKKTGRAMKESVQKLHNQLDSRYNKAHSYLKNLYQTEMTRLTENNESIDLLAAQMTSACEFANKACQVTQSSQILTSQTQIIKRLHELENTDLPTIESDMNDFAFTAKHDTTIQQIEDSLQQLCDVDWLVQSHAATGLADVKKKDGSALSAGGRGDTQVDPSQCTIEFVNRGKNRLGHNIFSATVQTVDFNGERITTGGAKLEATQDEGGSRPVHDNKDGTYTITGLLRVYSDKLHVKIKNGTPMRGCGWINYSATTTTTGANITTALGKATTTRATSYWF